MLRTVLPPVRVGLSGRNKLATALKCDSSAKSSDSGQYLYSQFSFPSVEGIRENRDDNADDCGNSAVVIMQMMTILKVPTNVDVYDNVDAVIMQTIGITNML
jgi:hypothetical protein